MRSVTHRGGGRDSGAVFMAMTGFEEQSVEECWRSDMR